MFIQALYVHICEYTRLAAYEGSPSPACSSLHYLTSTGTILNHLRPLILFNLTITNTQFIHPAEVGRLHKNMLTPLLLRLCEPRVQGEDGGLSELDEIDGGEFQKRTRKRCSWRISWADHKAHCPRHLGEEHKAQIEHRESQADEPKAEIMKCTWSSCTERDFWYRLTTFLVDC